MDHFPSSNKAYKLLNSLPNETNLAWSILKAFADNKIYETEKLKFVLGRVENITEKKKMLVTSIFSFSNNVFKRLFLQGRQKSRLSGEELSTQLQSSLLNIFRIRQIKCASDDGIRLQKGRENSGSRRKCWFPSFSPVPIMVFINLDPKIFNSLPYNLHFQQPRMTFKPFENIVGKTENAGYQNEQFQLFLRCFLCNLYLKIL